MTLEEVLAPLQESLARYQDLLTAEIQSMPALVGHACSDVRRKTAEITRLTYTVESLFGEIHGLTEKQFKRPNVGEYLCHKNDRKKAYLVVVSKVDDPTISYPRMHLNPTYGYITLEPLTMYGKKAATGRVKSIRYSFKKYADYMANGILRPAPYILLSQKGYDIGDVDALIPLIPFLGIPKGEHLSITMLRQLARQVRKCGTDGFDRAK